MVMQPVAARPFAISRQRSLAGIGDVNDVPLHEVTFCAVDLETTSGSWKDGEIVEIGAVKSRGGEIIGTFETFVQPSGEIPIEIQMLTGITPGMLVDALPLPAVLPQFIEFCGASVFVAHNARFDKSFIDAACRRLDYEISSAPIVDTVRLARRLLKNEVRSCGLHSLAAHFRTSTKPNHRAFPDAAACLEVLWSLLERASAYGVVTLTDLLEIQSVRSNPHFEKVKLARKLPMTRGVYLFENARREVIYVGKAANLRARVRSYFTQDERKRMGDLRAEIADVRVIHCATDLEAGALEARLIDKHKPRYNRAGIRRRAPVYLRLTSERHPRFAVARSPREGQGLHIGPFASTARARSVAATLSGLFGLRTCTLKLNGKTHDPCALYALGSCHGPCTGDPSDVAAHDSGSSTLRGDLETGGLRTARELLGLKLSGLAEQSRFEEAAGHRDAFADLVRAVDRARRLQALASAGRVHLATTEGDVVLDSGRLPGAEDGEPGDHGLCVGEPGLGERQAVAAWLERATDIRLMSTERPLAYPWPRAELLESITLQELPSERKVTTDS
jgi:DNA polymerase III subunit epsilon